MKIITINREYGSGGREIGLRTAAKLGIELYDKDIMRATARESGFDISLIQKEEESISRGESILRAVTPMSFNERDVIRDIQRRVILELAAKGPCVLLGRSAELVLAEAGIDALTVFIHADQVHRAVAVGGYLNSTNADEIAAAIHRKDHDRNAYYVRFGGRHWGDARNYDLCLDSGALGYDLCAEIIARAAET